MNIFEEALLIGTLRQRQGASRIRMQSRRFNLFAIADLRLTELVEKPESLVNRKSYIVNPVRCLPQL